ncbi:MAG: aminofutalosine synthase MqnE [Symbiobacteriia bacterium]
MKKDGEAMEALLEHVYTPEWQRLLAKVRACERLNPEDGLFLLTTNRLSWLGALADEARRLRVGDQVYFNNNAHINYSNICAIHCRFCAFGKTRKSPDGYTYSIEQIVEKARAYGRMGVTELHMVGGLHPDLPFGWYLEMLRRVKTAVPQAHLKCFTAIEMLHFAKISRQPLADVMRQLKDAGLDSMPGGGAEIFSQRVRDIICKAKETAEEWLWVHDTAHRLGLKTNATMLYGHIETPEEIVDHLVRLREQQDQTGGFQAFIPLAFHPANTDLADLPGPTGYLDLRVVAVARLLLDNFNFIKSYWVMMSPRLAQISLTYGANDVDGTVREEKIYHMAGATTPQAQTPEELLSLIWEAGRIPAERDTLYNVIREYPARPPADWRPVLVGETLQPAEMPVHPEEVEA